MRSTPTFPFRPPKNNSLFIKLVQYIIEPIMLLFIPKISKIEIDPGDLSLLKSLKGKRVILTPNHAEMTEPYVIFALSRMLREEFNYLTAREVFEDYFPAGRLLQAVGCYSVVRGTPDRNALRATTEILVEGKHWLVIFPEGVAVGLGDVLMPFQPGIGQFAFRAYEELTKKKIDGRILFIPIAVRMFYPQKMDVPIDRALQRLEKKLIPGVNQGGKNPLERLLMIGDTLLQTREKEYGIHSRPDTPLCERIGFMKELVIARTAKQIGIEDRPEQILPDRLRELINALDQMMHKKIQGSDEEQKIQRNQRDKAKTLSKRLETAVNFMALDSCYLEAQMTTERFLDIVGLFEKEVFGKRRFWGQRKAVIKVGKPVDLYEYKERFRENRKNTLQEISGTLESAVRSMLLELSAPVEFLKTTT
jgi:1-acyl-sn-glycerol-3-phosphate acyltransferase